MDKTEQGYEKVSRWKQFQQYERAQERVLRTLNLTESLAVLSLFVYQPAAWYGFVPVSLILWVVLLFGGQSFARQVEERFPEDAAVRKAAEDADARSTDPFRWGEFLSTANGRLFILAVVQAAAIVFLWRFHA